MQYGGWYDNPDTGKNQRWFDGIWTDGEEPSSGGVYWDRYKDTLSGFEDQVNAFADELIAEAQGDYDFAAKWIEKNFQTALGTDNKARAEFMKSVANALEAKVGRIAFDYQTGTYRAEQDASIATERTNYGADKALQRLAEDERIAKEQYGIEDKEMRQNQNEELNARGVIQGARDGQGGLAGREIGELERGIADRYAALERAVSRGKTDIEDNRRFSLFDIDLSKTRTLEDLKTGARRAAQDEQDSHDYQMDYQKRLLAQRKSAAERERKSGLDTVKSYAEILSSPS